MNLIVLPPSEIIPIMTLVKWMWLTGLVNLCSSLNGRKANGNESSSLLSSMDSPRCPKPSMTFAESSTVLEGTSHDAPISKLQVDTSVKQYHAPPQDQWAQCPESMSLFDTPENLRESGPNNDQGLLTPGNSTNPFDAWFPPDIWQTVSTASSSRADSTGESGKTRLSIEVE